MSVTLTFHLFFMHWSHYPPIWMSPSDYQSFIYFRAVSHKKRVYKSVTCHRFLPSLLLEPVCWVTPVTRVFSFFVEGSVTPVTHRYYEKKWIFISPSINNLLILDKKSNPFLPAFHFLFVILHPENIRLI